MKLSTKITALTGIGEKTANLFHKLNIYSIGDLIFTYPRTYLDLSEIKKISELSHDRKHTFRAELAEFRSHRLRRRGRRTMQRGKLRDETTEIDVIWFNMPFLEDALTVGNEYNFVGKLSRNKKTGKVQLVAPSYEKKQGDAALNSGRIVPVYKLTNGLSPRVYRKHLKNLLDNLDLFGDELPRIDNELRFEKELLPIELALKNIHFPESQKLLEQSKFRLAITELIPIQIKLIKQHRERKQANMIFSLEKTSHNLEDLLDDYWDKFPFDPTKDQVQACRDIYKDFSGVSPAYRLIQGDVGTGKTAVAGFAIYLSLIARKDVVLMVPTTVLANQHYEKFTEIFPDETVLVTGNTKVEDKTDKPALYVGTQALLHRYKQMKLEPGTLIIDEEHRFGVKQREEISKLATPESSLPHYLSLTATPIPRSLTLSIFGHMDISVITTKPSKQLPKKTFLVPESKKDDSYEWIREKLEEGNQVFWICPLIEETKEVGDDTVIIQKSEKATVAETYKKLKKIFSEFKLKQLHGKLKSETKDRRLIDFKQKKFDILVSTTVIEVGIDIPNANVMAIEAAENFGLAQLHQLRGRVGRGEKQGYCLLYSNNLNHERLKFFAGETDGLKLAEFDLQSRGPGEVYGTMQSGIPDLQLADITDEEQIKVARKIALHLMN